MTHNISDVNKSVGTYSSANVTQSDSIETPNDNTSVAANSIDIEIDKESATSAIASTKNDTTESLSEFAGGYDHPANRQLELLGYRRNRLDEENEKVYIRALGANGAAKSFLMQFPLSQENILQLNSYSKRKYGIYVVVNGSGHTDEFVRDCKASFFEFDHMPLEDQLNIAEKYNLPRPSLQVDTGGKSIHQYYIFNAPIAKSLWVELQYDLIHLLKDCDKALKNPSRVLRLSGFAHQKTGKKSQIISIGERIDFDTLRDLIPERSHEVKQTEAKKKRQIASNRAHIEDVIREFEPTLKHIKINIADIQKLLPEYCIDPTQLLNKTSRGVLAGECRISSETFDTLLTDDDQEYPICKGSLNATYRNTGEDIRVVTTLLDEVGLIVHENIALGLFDRLVSLTEFKEVSAHDDVWRDFNDKNDCKPEYVSGLIKRLDSKLNSDYSKLLKANQNYEDGEIKIENMSEEQKNALIDDDLMDIALNSGTSDKDDEAFTQEEIEARKISNQERFNNVITSVNDLEITDNLDLFTPRLAEHIKALIDEKQVRGGGRAIGITGCVAMSAIAPCTIVECKPFGINRPSLPYFWNIGESAVGKGDFAFKPIKSVKTFLKQLDEFSLNKDITLLQREIDNENTKLKEDVESCFKTKIKHNNTVYDFGINTKFLFNYSSSKEGSFKDIGNQLAAQRLHKKHPEYFVSLYSHPQGAMIDEFELFAEKIYGSNNEIYLNKVDLCQLKEDFNNDNANKKLTSGATVVGTRPIVFSGNMTTKNAVKHLSTEKKSQDGFSGRLILNFQDGKRFEIDPSKYYKIKPNKLTSEDSIRLLILGASICNHIEALIQTRKNLDNITVFNLSKNAIDLYAEYVNPGGKKDKICNKIKSDYPDWISLIENIEAKNWQIIMDIAPNLKRLNWGVENFLNRLKIIYPGRTLDDFAPLLEVNGNGDEFIKFAKILTYKLNDGHKYESNLAENLTLEKILTPIVIDANGLQDVTEVFPHDRDLYTYAYESASYDLFSHLDYTITDQDMKFAIDIAANSLHSFGNFLAANKFTEIFADTQSLANEARAQDTLRKSESDSGELLRIQDLIKVLNDRYTKNNIKFSVAEITRISRKLQKIEQYIPDILIRIIDVGGFINEIGKNKKGATMYEIIKIPNDTDIRKFAISKI